ncbi:RNA-dependent ATPase rok1 [Lignoscripta atroalba]|nr:RNA-dependent ATPase rok1 [Lignoscripta atroalba]
MLTRSTNLQKSSSATRQIAIQQVPSAGNPKSVQAPSIDPEATTIVPFSHLADRTQRGIKRKRPQNEGAQVSEKAPELDFFADRRDQISASQDPRKSIYHVEHKDRNDREKRGPNEASTSMTSEEDCRRILKSHKIKVTLMKADIKTSIKSKNTSKRLSKLPGQASTTKDGFTQLSPQPLTSFRKLRTNYGLSKRIAENLDAQGYMTPTEVQMGSFPLLLGSDEDRGLRASKTGRSSTRGRKSEIDLLTVAPTGSGKTLAFLIPVLQGLLSNHRSRKNDDSTKREERQVQAVIVAPTHELADQIVNEARKLSAGTGVKVAGMRKGMRIHQEQRDSRKTSEEDNSTMSSGDNMKANHTIDSGTEIKADIVVSTPLMLVHAISVTHESPITLPSVRYLVLDEADVLLDPMFRTQTLDIWTACTNPSLQTSLWSATIGSSIESLAQTFILERRKKLNLKASHHHIIRLIVGLKDSSLPTISHRLVYAATEQGKLLALRELLHPSTSISSTHSHSLRPPFLVFTQTIPRAVALHSELLYDIPPEAGGSSRIAVLHSDLSETARSNIMTGFRKGEIWVLITTDLLSRGVDFRGINGVVNYDIPNTGAVYVHRAGRTGRAGREGGMAITLYTKEDIPYVKNVANVIAASEKAKGKVGVGDAGVGVQKWLLDALPAVSKKTKKDLKQRGVEVRRTVTGDGAGGRDARKMRISTKSGFDRRMENRRKGAMVGSQKRVAGEVTEAHDASEEEWGGIEV